MKNKPKIHKWNVVLVTSLRMPHQHMEFNVDSQNILGATMKASKTLKGLNKEDKDNFWRITSIYWLDPINYTKEQE